jgi:hypothetical protein
MLFSISPIRSSKFRVLSNTRMNFVKFLTEIDNKPERIPINKGCVPANLTRLSLHSADYNFDFKVVWRAYNRTRDVSIISRTGDTIYTAVVVAQCNGK